MNIFKNLFKPRIYPVSGVLPDNRPPEEKEKDYLTDEILTTAAPLNYRPWTEWKSDPRNIKRLKDIKVKFQDGVGSCGSMASALDLEINEYLEDGKYTELSPRSIYARRRNKPNRGMYADDIGNIITKYGAIPEVFCPSPNDTEAHMSNLDDIVSLYEDFGKATRAGNYIWLYGKDIDKYARVVALDIPVIFTVLFGEHEWGRELAPQIRDTKTKYGHANVFLPSGLVEYQGKKALVDQDSWGTGVGYGGRRIITEDWFLAGRILLGLWTKDLNNLAVFNQEGKKLPHYQWTRDLYIGKRGADVAMLQTALAMIKDDNGYLFPLWKGQAPTGYFAGLTRSAVKKFQVKYNITPTLGYFGPKTRAKLNAMCK